ncbi:MAG: TlyA family RNA methyltransferase [Chloroflexota bacterium]|nr:MAG: TlyA family RNA methyltransferase [Chloroflexota bacterium]
MKKLRIDIILVEKGFADDLSLAQRLVMAGKVRVNNQLVLNPSAAYPENVSIQLAESPRFVSRGGDKLQSALEVFKIDVTGMTCADVGASTGGFSDCLLQNGCKRIYAIDVGRGILHWKIRQDPRVNVMEGVNARSLESLPELIDLVTLDASFISSKVLLPVIKGWLNPSSGQVIVLIKPQFEARKEQTSAGRGVIRDPEIHKQVLNEVLTFAESEGYQTSGLMRSPVVGPKGNIEFLARCSLLKQPDENLKNLIDSLFPVEE